MRYAGVKSWISACRWQGKQQTLTLGKYPTISLSEARRRNLEVKTLLADGITPKHDKKEQQAERDGSKSFDTIAQSWHNQRKAHITAKTHSRDYSQYQRDIKPFIGDKNIDDITSPEVLAIGKAMAQRGATDMAQQAVRQVGQIFKHAKRQGLVTHNPATDLVEALPKHTVKHHHRITARQLPKLLQDIEAYGGQPLVKMGLWMFCYTFLRTTELRLLRWDEIDWQAKVIRLSAERMKMNRPHIVPLAPQVIDILTKIKEMSLSDEWGFYNTSHHQPYSENAYLNALKRMGYNGIMTGHGFRGLASTTLHERGFKHEAIDAQLAHEKENRVSKAYDGSQYLNDRRDMMTKWKNYVDDAFAGKTDNLITFKADEAGVKIG